MNILILILQSKIAERVADKLYNNMTRNRIKWIVRLAPVAGMVILIAGYIVGSLWVGKGQDEMMRQLAQALMIATGGVN